MSNTNLTPPISLINEFYLIWSVNGVVQTGYNKPTGEYQVIGNWINNPLYLPIGFPGVTNPNVQVSLNSSAIINNGSEILTNVCFYLTGDESSLLIVRDLWPSIGDSYYPPRPDLSGGLDISFDLGNNWTRITTTIGNVDIPSTWIPMPAIATNNSDPVGQIGPRSTCNILVRLVIPPNTTDYQTLNLNLAIDCDIL